MTAASYQSADLLENHVTEYDSVLFICLLKAIQKQMHHITCLAYSAVLLEFRHTGAEHIKTGNTVRRTSSELLFLPLLLFLNIADASHQLPALAVRIIYCISGEGHPFIIGFFRPVYPEFYIKLIRLTMKHFNHSHTVKFVNILRINKSAFILNTFPLSAQSLMIYDI